MPNLSTEQIAQLSALVGQYIAGQREKFRPRASSPDSQLRTNFVGFFAPDLLESVRLTILTDERVANPEFYPMLMSMGFTNLPDQSAMQAITFVDTVVSHGRLHDATLFHELVHAEQYRQLGVAKFSELYVRGFLDGGGYMGIPLEQNAYTLQALFEQDRSRRFSVADSVSEWIRGR